MIKNKFLSGIMAAVIALCSVPAYAQVIGQAVAGQDGTGTQRTFLTDNTGRMLIVGSGSGGQVFGPDANGVPPTQPPVYTAGLAVTGDVRAFRLDAAGNGFTQGIQINGGALTGGLLRVGGSDGTSARDLLTDNTGRLITVAGGGTVTINGSISGLETAGSPVVGNGLRVMGSDGTNARDLLTDATGKLSVIGSVGITNQVGVIGTIASGSVDSGNPVKTGAVYNATTPVVATTQRIDNQADSTGAQYVNTTSRLLAYAACGSGVDAPGGSGRTAIQFQGVATKTIRITGFSYIAIASVAAPGALFSARTTSPATGGTSATPTLASFSGTTAVGAPLLYSVPGSIPGSFGLFNRIITTVPVNTSPQNFQLINYSTPVVLSGTGQYWLLFYNAPANTNYDMCVYWTEE